MKANFKKICKNIKHTRERGVHSEEVQARLAYWREGGVGRRVCLCSDCKTAFGLEDNICSPNLVVLVSVRVKGCSNQEVPLYPTFSQYFIPILPSLPLTLLLLNITILYFLPSYTFLPLTLLQLNITILSLLPSYTSLPLGQCVGETSLSLQRNTSQQVFR